MRTLEVDAPGWNVDLIGPGNLVNVDAVIAGQNNPLVIPLLQATSGEIEVTFEAHQDLTVDAGKLALRLPVPRGESVAAANVTVAPADNVELQFEPESSRDLAPQPLRPATPNLPQRQQEPLFLRTVGDSPTLVASFKVHGQEISAAITNQIEIDEQSAQVDAHIDYQIAYEPTDHVELAIPRALRLDQLSVTLDGERLTPQTIRETDGADEKSAAMARVALPTPRIGRCDLQVKYSVPVGKLADEANTLIDVPLVIPGEGKLTSNQLTVVAKPGLSLAYPNGPWTEDASPSRAANATGLRLAANRAIPSVALAVSIKQRQVEHTTSVNQAWIETSLTDSRRRDRAVFRLSTSEPSLRVKLPSGVEPASLEVELDGRRYAQAVDLANDASTFTLTIPGGSSESHLLELRYLFNDRSGKGSLSLDAPKSMRRLGPTSLLATDSACDGTRVGRATNYARVSLELVEFVLATRAVAQPARPRPLDRCQLHDHSISRCRRCRHDRHSTGAKRCQCRQYVFVQHRGRRRTARDLHDQPIAPRFAGVVAVAVGRIGANLLSSGAPPRGAAGGRRGTGGLRCDRSGFGVACRSGRGVGIALGARGVCLGARFRASGRYTDRARARQLAVAGSLVHRGLSTPITRRLATVDGHQSACSLVGSRGPAMKFGHVVAIGLACELALGAHSHVVHAQRTATPKATPEALPKFHRSFVPADKISEGTWTQGYFPIDAADFRRLVETVNAAAIGAPVPGAAIVEGAEYSARLVGEDLLVGEATIHLKRNSQEPAMLELAPWSLAMGAGPLARQGRQARRHGNWRRRQVPCARRGGTTEDPVVVARRANGGGRRGIRFQGATLSDGSTRRRFARQTGIAGRPGNRHQANRRGP